MEILYNPFQDAGIMNYEQFKLYPFLVFGTLESIKNRIEEQIKQIKNGYFFGERLIILGDRGIGKTSSLFFIKDMLEEGELEVYYFTRLFEDEETIKMRLKEFVERKYGENKTNLIFKEKIGSLFKKPVYILIDFPDSLDMGTFKRFLIFLWDLMNRKEYNKINLIFSMNKSHYDKSFTYSEVFGKFMNLRLDKFTFEETEKMISSRLKLVNLSKEEVFSREVLETIHNYSKGVPRNIISACSILISNSNRNKITKEKAEEILKEKYFDQVLNDRVEDLELRLIYKQMISVLKTNFQGVANSQEDYVRKAQEITGIGRNSVLNNIRDLVKYGIFNQYKGGYNRVNKILSLN